MQQTTQTKGTDLDHREQGARCCPEQMVVLAGPGVLDELEDVAAAMGHSAKYLWHTLVEKDLASDRRELTEWNARNALAKLRAVAPEQRSEEPAS
ncbi:hypothetical protein ACFL59_01260 [Planctomycetota bacterium]